MEKQWKQWLTLFSWAPKSLQIVTAAMKLKAPGGGRGQPTPVTLSGESPWIRGTWWAAVHGLAKSRT